MGFSNTTCLPARTASNANATCVPLGVHTDTTSTSEPHSANSAVSVSCAAGDSTAERAAGSVSAMATSWVSGCA
ncbi:MAG: hypothetical protein CL822_05475 [Crocinitomicaceae bacterium]|nr:hypothetical protein [Crocinitomicaceae bacterium]